MYILLYMNLISTIFTFSYKIGYTNMWWVSSTRCETLLWGTPNYNNNHSKWMPSPLPQILKFNFNRSPPNSNIEHIIDNINNNKIALITNPIPPNVALETTKLSGPSATSHISILSIVIDNGQSSLLSSHRHGGHPNSWVPVGPTHFKKSKIANGPSTRSCKASSLATFSLRLIVHTARHILGRGP